VRHVGQRAAKEQQGDRLGQVAPSAHHKHSLDLGLGLVWISAELQPHFGCKAGGDFNHDLHCASSWGGTHKIISLGHCTHKGAAHVVADTSSLDVDGERSWQKDGTLPSQVADSEKGGFDASPMYLEVLPLVHKDEGAHDHSWEQLPRLGEQHVKSALLKRLGHVKCHHDGVAALIQEVGDSLYGNVAALGS
jgi:hypothetical protein